MRLPIHSPFTAPTLLGARRRQHLSRLLAVSLALSVGLGPLVQPVAAQSATPTPVPATPTPVPTASNVITLNPNTFNPNAGLNLPPPTATPQTLQGITIQTGPSLTLSGPIATSVPVTSIPGCSVGATICSVVPTPAPITIAGCNGPNRIFQTCTLNGTTGIHLEQQAEKTLLQEHKLPASDQGRVMEWARNDLRASIFSNLVATFKKDPSQRTPDEQTAVSTLTKLVQQKHVQVAEAAQNEYNSWFANPCGYRPPAGFSYNASSACASPAGLLFRPASPGLSAFDAYAAAEVYQPLQNDPAVQVTSAATAGALMLAYGYAAAVGAGALGAVVGAIVPASVVGAIHPFLAASVAANVAAATTAETEAATEAAAEVASALATVGPLTFAGPAAILVACVVTLVVGGMSVFQDAAIPGQLRTGLNTASGYDVGSAIRSTDSGTSTSAQQELYGAFIPMTLPDFPPTDAVPAPQPGDPQLIVNGTPMSSMAYLAGDKSKHTVRVSSGWFVDTDANGKSSLTLSIDYTDQNGKDWRVSPIGSQFLMSDPGNPSAAGYAQPQLVTAFSSPASISQTVVNATTAQPSSDVRLVDMNQTGSGKTEVHILTAGSNYAQWSIETGTALDMSTANQWAFAFAPNTDLYAIKLNNTGSGHTEVHILSAASKYQQFSLHIATPLPETDPNNWTFQVGANGDLYAITTTNSGSGKVEVHILTAASNFQNFSNEVATALGEVDPTKWEFHLTANNDLLGVFLNGTGSGQTEVHILSAASNYQQYRLEVPTALGPTDRANWQFRMGANDDLLGIFLNGTHSGTTEVHRLSASSSYGQYNLEVPTALHQDGPGFWNFGVGSLVY